MARLILKHDDGTEEVLHYNVPDGEYITVSSWWRNRDVFKVIKKTPGETDDEAYIKGERG